MPSPFVPEGAGGGGNASDFEYEAKLGDVLLKINSEDIGELKYSGSSKPVDFETWLHMTRLSLESRHSQLVSWWDAANASAKAAYEQ